MLAVSLQGMAVEAPNMAVAKFRRPNQDYSSCNVFLPLQVWRNLFQAKSERAKAEELAEFLYQQLELRLPTEPTYATMTALVSCNGTPSRFDLHSSLQTVKAAWRGIAQRLQKISKEDKKAELLSALPTSWEELPERIRLLWGDMRPAGCQDAPKSESDILRLAAKVPLRETDGAVAAMKAQPQLEMASNMLKLLGYHPARSPQKSRAPEAGLLKNLQIFASPNNRTGSTEPRKDLALERRPQECMVQPSAASHAEHNLIAKLTQPMAALQQGDREERAASACGDASERRDAALAQTAPQGEKGLAVVETGMPAGHPSHHPSQTTVPARKGLALEGMGASVRPPSHHASQRAGESEKPSALVEPEGQPEGQPERRAAKGSAPRDGLKAHAGEFLKARGEAVEGKKGRKRKASPAAVLKRPAARAQKKPAGVVKTKAIPAQKEVKTPKRNGKKTDQQASPATGKIYANKTFEAKFWGHCRVEFYSAKSYIRFFCKDKGRLSMVIGSVHGQHQEICDRLVPHVQKGKRREELHAVRAQLETSFG